VCVYMYMYVYIYMCVCVCVCVCCYTHRMCFLALKTLPALALLEVIKPYHEKYMYFIMQNVTQH